MITKKRKYGKKGDNDLRSLLYFLFFLIFVFGIIGYLTISNWNITQKRAELRLQKQELQREVQTLKARKAQLEAGVYQTTQDEYLEEKIREQGYKKQGEEAVVIKKEIEEDENQEQKERGFLDKLLGKLKRD